MSPESFSPEEELPLNSPDPEPVSFLYVGGLDRFKEVGRVLI